MWIGGAVGGVGLGAFVYALCEGLNETDESCVGPGLVGVGLGALGGGLVGALIGGAFTKRDTLPSADSTASSP